MAIDQDRELKRLMSTRSNLDSFAVLSTTAPGGLAVLFGKLSHDERRALSPLASADHEVTRHMLTDDKALEQADWRFVPIRLGARTWGCVAARGAARAEDVDAYARGLAKVLKPEVPTPTPIAVVTLGT